MADKRPLIQIPEWQPDVTDLGTDVSALISGVVPRADGYGPFKALETFTQALASRCRGYFFARRGDGSSAVFAGTSTELYILDNTNLTWTKVSKGGGPYSALVATDIWRFAQFNDTVLAVQQNTVAQAFALSSSAAFADLAGSPPQASHVAIVNRFVLLSGLLSNPRRLQWCDLDDITQWTAGVGFADFQDFPDGGSVHGISGGDAYGVVFQDESIRRVTYAPGSATVFDIVRISTQDTLFAQYSVINVGDKTFYCSSQGFKLIEASGLPRAIGKERVDRTFFSDVDTSQLQLMIGSGDPSATRVYWAYKSKAGQADLFDKVLCYDWSIGEIGRWSMLPIRGQFLTYLAKPGLTLEQLDAIAPGALTVLGTADNGSGLIRLELDALSNGPFDIHGQNFIVVQGVTGTTEANGTWKFTIIDATHIDLIGSAYANAYVSGGAIGGSLDALPFSLDSVSTAAVARLSAFDENNKLGFFDGDNIEAIIETSEQDLQGQMIYIDAVRPITDCATAMVSIAGRMNASATSTYTDENGLTDAGDSPQSVETRYAKARVRMPAGATWTYIRGVQPRAVTAGDL